MENPDYDAKKSISKALPPLILAVIIESLSAALDQNGVAIGKDHLYQAGAGIMAGYFAIVNWLKNRKKKK